MLAYTLIFALHPTLGPTAYHEHLACTLSSTPFPYLLTLLFAHTPQGGLFTLFVVLYSRSSQHPLLYRF